MATKYQIDKRNFRFILKYLKIQNQFSKLYNIDRIRIDDVMLKLEIDFQISSSRLAKILNFKLPKQTEIEQFLKIHKPKANIDFLTI